MTDPVDWTVTERRGYRTLVQVTCPICQQTRMDDAASIRYRLKHGTYTGCCYRDRLIHKARRDRLPRLPHPQVNWLDMRIVATPNGRRATHVGVVCPECREHRYVQTGALAAKIRAGSFTGRCSPCVKQRDWIYLSPGRAVDPAKGYVRLTRAAITSEDRPLYEAMRGRTSFVFEHRMVMARSLGRPLTRNELVDHRDGVKTNNDLANLRLYRRGANEDGSGNGYGTYYDEWQRAEARIRELEASR